MCRFFFIFPPPLLFVNYKFCILIFTLLCAYMYTFSSVCSPYLVWHILLYRVLYEQQLWKTIYNKRRRRSHRIELASSTSSVVAKKNYYFHCYYFLFLLVRRRRRLLLLSGSLISKWLSEKSSYQSAATNQKDMKISNEQK